MQDLENFEKEFVDFLRKQIDKAQKDLENVKEIMAENYPEDIGGVIDLRDDILHAKISEDVDYAVDAAASSITMKLFATMRKEIVLYFRKYFAEQYTERIAKNVENYLIENDRVKSFVCDSLSCILSDIAHHEPEEDPFPVYALYADDLSAGVIVVAAKNAKLANIIVHDYIKNNGKSHNEFSCLGEIIEDFRVEGMSCDKAGILVDTITKKYYTF